MTPRRPVRSALIRILPIIATLLCASFSSAQFAWIGNVSGNWSNGAMWQGGVAPPPGGGPTVSLTFSNSGTAAWTATNDRGNPFALNLLNLNNVSTGVFKVLSASNNGLLFQGGNAGIVTSGPGSATIDAGGSGLILGANFGITGTGTGLYSINSVIAETSGSHGIAISVDPAATVSFTGSNTFSGGVILNSGNLVGSTANPFGTGGLAVYGGTVQMQVDCDTSIALFADLVSSNLHVGQNGQITSAVSGTGLQVTGPFTMRGVGTYDGPTSISLAPFSILANGAFTNTSNIAFIETQATIENRLGNLSNRLNDAAPLGLRDSTLIFNSGAGGTSERIGDVSFEGANQIFFTTIADGPTVVSSHTISGLGQACVLLSGRNLGDVPGPHVCDLLLDTAPELVGGGGGSGTTNISIVPGVFSDWNTTSDPYVQEARTLVTYGSNGLRPLDPSTEFSSSFTTGANVRISSGFQNHSDYTINSLVGYASSIIGAATLHVTSATVQWVSGELDNSLDFGSRTGNIWALAFDYYGALIGSNGVNINGSGITLWGVNTGLTGPFDFNGTLTIRNAVSLPGTGDIRGRGWLSAGPALTIARNINMTGDLTLSNLTCSGVVSGRHALTLTGTRLSGANTYSGSTTFISNGYFSSDTAFGASPLIVINPNGLRYGPNLEGDWTTSRSINVDGNGGINTGGFTATLNGPTKISAALTKNQAGTLVLNNVTPSSSAAITVTGGTLAMNCPASNVSVEVASDGVASSFTGSGPVKDITLDPAGTISPGVSGAGTLSGASLKWYGGGHITFDLGPSSDGIALSGALTKAGSGAYTFDFALSPSFVPGTYTLMTFGSTGFSASDFSYTAPANVIGTFSIVGNQLKFTAQMIVPPDSYQLVRGTLVSGGLSELVNSDDQYLVVRRIVTSILTQPPITTVVTGTAPTGQPNSIKVHIESHASQAGLQQSIELWDYMANQWVQVDVRSIPTSDQVTEASVSNPSRFVEPATHHMMARYSYSPVTAQAAYFWRINFDQTIWIVG